MSKHQPESRKASPPHEKKGYRDLRLDACRGLALWFIFIDHVPDNTLAWLTLRNYGFSDTSEVFVFVSGYTCMLAYGGALEDQGWSTVVTRALRRSLEIYCAFLLLLVAYIAVIWLVGGGERFVDETNTGFFFKNPGEAIVRAALLQYAPVNTDILPTFVLLHLAFPPLLWLLMRIPVVTLAASFLLYLMVQLQSWHVPAWPSGELYFNPFAFQLLFVFGAWYAGGGADLIRPLVEARATLIAAMLYLAFSLIVVLSWQFDILNILIPDSVTKLIYPIYKSHLAPVRLLHFLALAVVVSRLTPPDLHGPVRPFAIAMIRCGENSLSMYCFGVLLSFAGLVVLTDLSASLMAQVAVSVIGIAIMVLAATIATWEAQLDRRGPKLF
ncbi:OpgC domain-containing protein [Bradyrhizobium liaoningense]|uniref:OpgC domain-containing protein n=1 Tax=Bradyrhizobium liaoningense TaxID=43992 RepID=UPI001BA5AF5F|nr:OpgC domain-containing protein [Bradyrhizobium liaoningense]MBR0712950.1 OpgC domain-containing protein [Bradyrhizobium liaoningense]